jgi:aminoglycoside 3-N-acetyltransferase I
MAANIDIRRLGPGDALLLTRLNRMFSEAFEDAETYGARPPGEAYVETLLGKPHIVVLAATAGEEVIGGLVAYELEKFEQARSEIYIYDLAVDAAWRRRGLATALIARTQDIAAERGAWVVFVQADYSDPPAVALYEKLGRREEVLHFDIPVRRG